MQPFCRANNINMCYFDGIGVFPRTVTERTKALYLYNRYFCLIWNPENVSFIQAIQELNKISSSL